MSDGAEKVECRPVPSQRYRDAANDDGAPENFRKYPTKRCFEGKLSPCVNRVVFIGTAP